MPFIYSPLKGEQVILVTVVDLIEVYQDIIDWLDELRTFGRVCDFHVGQDVASISLVESMSDRQEQSLTIIFALAPVIEANARIFSQAKQNHLRIPVSVSLPRVLDFLLERVSASNPGRMDSLPV